MTRIRAPLALAVLAFAIQLALLFGACAALPGPVRVALSFAALVMLPGHALLIALGGRGAVPPGGPWLASGWALGAGVAWLGAEILVTRAFRLPFTGLASWSLVPNAALWLLAAWRCSRAAAASDAAPAAPVLGRVALLFVAAAALLAFIHVARFPTPVSYYSDSPDHVGTIRRMMAEGDALPVDAFFRDAGRAGADPRKGLWHPAIATVATLAHADALEAWWALAALLAPLFVLNAAAFAFLVGGSTAAAVGAWALVLTYGGSMAVQYLREAVFSTKLGDQLALATATAVLADLDRRRAGSRAAAIALALGAVATHVFAALQFAIVFGALAVALWIRDRGVRPELRRLVVTSLALALACLPYLLWRARLSYAPGNIIHLEPQGLLILAPGQSVVSFGVLWDWFGLLWVVFPLSVWAWARSASRTALLYLLSSTVAVALLVFFPPVVALLEPRLGYLLMRFVWMLPLSAALAFAVPALAAAVRAGGLRGRATALAAGAGLAILLAPVFADAVDVLAHPGNLRDRDAFTSVLRWRTALAWMDRHLPQGTVVLSDPATSYSIPMMTRHWVTTLVDQHSSPNDSLALARILDARDALDPYGSFARTRDVVRRWGATAIALNDRFAEIPHLDYWAPNHAWYLQARARLDRAPGAFERVYDTGDFVVYRIHAAALDTIRGGGAARPYVRELSPTERSLVRPIGGGSPEILGLELSAASAVPGDTLAGSIEWAVARALPAGSYHVALRFDRPLPAGVSFPEWFGKPGRKLFEKLHHARYRFRVDHLPVAGDFGVDLWRPGEVVRDSFSVPVPRDIAAGEYRVQVVMLREPHYPNFRLSDYFLDHDYYSGVPAGTLRVTAVRPS